MALTSASWDSLSSMPNWPNRWWRLPLVPSIYAGTWLLDKLVRPARVYPDYQPYSPGVSVIIPERGNSELLRVCLTSLRSALEISEPHEVRVVVNGSQPRDYNRISAEFPEVIFSFSTQPMGFSEAIAAGLRDARYDWVYLLNSDMRLEPDALREALAWRAPHVFAVASQILFDDPTRRREETGWTAWRFSDGWLEIFDALPEDPDMVRGHLYAGGGSSLFRRALLEQLLDPDHPYHPLYWEDVEWGMRAWKHGYDVLFCPRSKAWHRYRATVKKFYRPAEVDRIFRTNGYRCQFRNTALPPFSRRLWQWLWSQDSDIFLHLLGPAEAWRILRARSRALADACRDLSLDYTATRYYPASFTSRRETPAVIVVTPYAQFPPAHGAAVRLQHMLEALTARYRVILLSDEADRCTMRRSEIERLASVHLVGGRPKPDADGLPRVARIAAHCHAHLRRELDRLRRQYRPAAVLVEHIELAALVSQRQVHPCPWIMTLHEVLLSPSAASAEDRYEAGLLKQFDRLVACSPEDAALLAQAGLRAEVVPNGVDSRAWPYVKSNGTRALLFAGPFRYAPNLEGIRVFLERVYPRLLSACPGLELWLLAGSGATEIAAVDPRFQQAGVRVFDQIDHNSVRDFYQRAALTINPVRNIRGSSVKVLESLAAGRVCVSTVEGARGFLEARFPSLVLADGIEDFEAPVTRFLLQEEERLAVENASRSALTAYDWRTSGRRLVQLVESVAK